MKVNSDKNQLLMPGNKAIANIDNNHIEVEDINELLYMNITVDELLTQSWNLKPLFKKLQGDKPKTKCSCSNFELYDLR